MDQFIYACVWNVTDYVIKNKYLSGGPENNTNTYTCIYIYIYG